MKAKLLNAILITILLAGLLPANVLAKPNNTETVRYHLLDYDTGASGEAVLNSTTWVCSETSYGGISCHGNYKVTSTSGGLYGSPGYGFSSLQYERYDEQNIGVVYYSYEFTHINVGNGPNSDVTGSDYAGQNLSDGTYTGTIDKSANASDTFNASYFSVGHYGYVEMYITSFVISPVPIPEECNIPDSPPFASGLIDPSLEIPTVEHEQLEPVIVGTNYVIQISGGPWDDGVLSDRYDTAFSWDGETWISITDFFAEEYVICYEYGDTQQELMRILFTAQTTTFYIRVNDTEEDFADNTEVNPLYYSLALGVASCSNQFVKGDLVATISVPANEEFVSLSWEVNKNGVSAPPITPNEWYVVEVDSGSWKDDGTGDDRYDVDLGWTPLTWTGTMDLSDLNPADAVWGDLSTVQGTYCSTNDGQYVTAYVQALNDQMLFRVSDDALTFGANTGAMQVSIYEATFTPALTGCALGWKLAGLIMDDSVDASSFNGKPLNEVDKNGVSNPVVKLYPNQSYMLETLGGPWQLSDLENLSAGSFDMEISDDNGETWQALDTWADAACIVQTDGVGHLQVYFTVPEIESNSPDYKLRVADNDFSNNSGSMNWRLNRVFELAPLGDGTCDFTYDVADILQDEDIAANNSTGLLLDLDYQPENKEGVVFGGYAVVITGGPWQEETGGSDDYDMAIDFGEGFENYLTTDDDHLLCRSTDGNDVTLYVRQDALNSYYLRVDSASFANNVGSRHVAVYPVSAGQMVNKWKNCLQTYNTVRPIGQIVIPVRQEDGVAVEFPKDKNGYDIYVPEGSYYAITTSGTWVDGSTDKIDAAISNDNGVTWTPLNEYDNVICYDQSSEGYDQIVINTAPGDYWRIRVNDDDGDFGDNTGNYYYNLYLVYNATTGTTDSNGNVIDSQYGGCSQACVRPEFDAESIIDIPAVGEYLAGWLAYLGCTIKQFFAWCPRHTQIINNISQMFAEREPFKTLAETNVMLESLNTEIHSRSWGGCVDANGNVVSCGNNYNDTAEMCMDNNGNTAPCNPSCYDSNGNVVPCSGTLINQPTSTASRQIDQLFNTPEDSPWKSGKLVDFNKTPPHTTNYYLSCTDELTESVNANIAGGICFVSNHYRESGAALWVQLIVDVVCVAMVVAYLFNIWNNFQQFMTG